MPRKNRFGMSLPYVVAFTVGVLITHLISDEIQARYLAAIAVIYAASIVLHPYRACWTCHGGSRHYGTLYTYAHRPCTSCGGSGRAPRLGAWIIGRR